MNTRPPLVTTGAPKFSLRPGVGTASLAAIEDQIEPNPDVARLAGMPQADLVRPEVDEAVEVIGRAVGERDAGGHYRAAVMTSPDPAAARRSRRWACAFG